DTWAHSSRRNHHRGWRSRSTENRPTPGLGAKEQGHGTRQGISRSWADKAYYSPREPTSQVFFRGFAEGRGSNSVSERGRSCATSQGVRRSPWTRQRALPQEATGADVQGPGVAEAACPARRWSSARSLSPSPA